MMHTNHARMVIENGSAPVRALHSLTRRDFDVVRAAVRLAGGGWTVEQHDDYEGYCLLLLTPHAGVDRPGFLVSGRTGAIELATVCGDEMTPLGSFPSIGAAMLALTGKLEQGSWAAAPPREAEPSLQDLSLRHGDDADLHAAMRADRACASGNAAEARGWAAIVRALEGAAGVAARR